MSKQELERRLKNLLTEQLVDRFTITEIVSGDLQVELTLKPHTPITERFVARLETALHQKIGSLSFFRVRRNVFMIRFTLERNDSDDPVADRIQELPSPYGHTGDLSGEAVTQDSLARRARNTHTPVVSAESVFQYKIPMAPLHVLTRFSKIKTMTTCPGGTQ